MCSVKMDIKEEKPCRLCFNVAIDEFEVIEEVAKEMLDVCRLKMNLDVSDHPLMCRNCSEALKRCYKYKSICDRMEEAFIKKETKFESREVWEGESGINGFSSICSFCMNRQATNNFIPISLLSNEEMFRNICQIFMPEMDLNVVKNSPICTYCKDNLEHYLKFAQNCCDTEKQITMYCQSKETNGNGKINLSDVQFLLTESKVECSDKCVIKQEADPPDNVYSESPNDLVKHTKLQVKKKALSKKGKIHMCTMCPYQAKRKDYLKNHLLSHKDNSEVKLYKCAVCTFETKRKNSLRNHSIIHKDTSEVETYKCALCTYDTKHKNNLRTHIITHRNISEVEMYKCALCTYETRYKRSLRNHMITHKDTSEVKMYKCTLCNFQTKHESYIRRHLIKHKNNSEVKTYKCALCTYEAKREKDLEYHMLIHNGGSEVKLYNCTMCSFTTKHRISLSIHLVTHKDISEVKMFKCELCNYEAKLKRNLNRHMLSHKDISEVKMHKCTLCIYQSKDKSNLKKHMVVHREPLEVKTYKCTICTFETKHRHAFRGHMITHKRMTVRTVQE